MKRSHKKRSVEEATALQQEQGEARLELDVVTGSLWQPSCQALYPVPNKIPLIFDSESQYRRTFEPLLMEEARGSLRAEFDEAVGTSRGWDVTVTRCAPAKDGVFHLTLRPGERGHATNLREGAIVVLMRPPGEAHKGGGQGPAGPGPGSLAAAARAATSAGRWPLPGGNGGGQQVEAVAPLLAAMVRMRCRDAGQALQVSVRPCCGNEAHKGEDSPCNRALHMMVGAGVSTEADDGSGSSANGSSGGAAVGGGADAGGGGSLWLWLVPLTSLITNVRELRVLQRLGDITLLPELLRPSSFGSEGAAELPQVWPQDARHDAFYKHLHSQYDVPQREAIVAAAAHLATPDDLAEARAQGIATGVGGAGPDDKGAVSAPGPGGKGQPVVPPITLVQGPPGTGKTHTVRGILNTWHSIMYHRHHSAWLRRAREILTRSSSAGSRGGGSGASSLLDAYCNGGGLGGGGAGNILDALSFAPLDAPKPRILVCAPSNAATDELLDRILTDGFCDFGGATYRPNVVRVGAEEAPLSAAVKAVWTEAMINRYEAMGPEAWALAYKDCEARISNCNVYMASMATKLATRGLDTESAQDLDRMAAELVRLNDHLNRAREEMSRLDRAGDQATSGPNRLPGYVIRRIREDLELSLMEEAEMVFTTLSSTGRAVFNRLGRGFDFVLIDEAAQAAEIAALQPLLYGCRRLVMVGDPQQLPATLFSAAAKETLLERSLFERLAQAGMAVKMLSVQYRMHPEIRAFPSTYFYSNRLQDGESVIRAAAQPPAYYATDLLKPYVVYDVCGGREWLQGRSRSNEVEADMALGLYLELLAAVRGRPGIGVAAADAAAAVFNVGGALPGGPGRDPTPPGGLRGPAEGGGGGGRAGSVERVLGPGPGQGPADACPGPPSSSPAASLAAQAFGFLAGYTLGVTVGIITPYRAQRELLRRKFVEALGPAVLDAVRIETVDSFQGKQLDVIILSCVRTVRPGPAGGAAAATGGVGFLADVRRMNVAITRAKQALWVLGQFAALRREASWSSLIADAEERGCIIHDASAGELCPEWESFQERYRAATARSQQEQGGAGAMAGVPTGMPPQPPMGIGIGISGMSQPPVQGQGPGGPFMQPQPQLGVVGPPHAQQQQPLVMQFQLQQQQPVLLAPAPRCIEDAPQGRGTSGPPQPQAPILANPARDPHPHARLRAPSQPQAPRQRPHAHQLQPQQPRLLGGQQHPQQAGQPTTTRGRGLVSMLPKHGKAPPRVGGRGRGGAPSQQQQQ